MDEEWPVTELNVKNTFFDAPFMLAQWEETRGALWVWSEEWQPRMRKAAPIAEVGREIIEQAKEEAFLAWGL